MSDKKQRFAREDYVRSMNQWYWERTNRLISEKNKKTIALVAASTIVSVTALLIAIFSRRSKYQ